MQGFFVFLLSDDFRTRSTKRSTEPLFCEKEDSMASIYPNLKDGKIISFKFKAFLGRDENDKQIFKCKTWIPAKAMSQSKLLLQAEKEATIWEHEAQEQFALEQKLFSPEEISFVDFTENKWFPSEMNNDEHRPSTIAFRRFLLKIILEYFQDVKLTDISDKTIEAYLDYLKNTYRTKHGTQVSQQTMRHHYCTLNLILEYAVKIRYLRTNPMKEVKTPKLAKHKVDALSKGEVLTFIREIENLPLMQRTIYTLLLTTGVRRGECFGLQWGDVDFENRLIRVERNVTYTKEHGITVGRPKTDTGFREIPLTDGVIELLTDYKKEEGQQASLSDDMFLFHSADSRYQAHDPTYITKHMKKFMKRVGLPDMSPHDLRHTCASLLLQSGADVKSVQDILGHADASTTLNFYVRSDIDAMRESTQKAFEW